MDNKYEITLDEADVRDSVESVKKCPEDRVPSILDWYHWDLFLLHVLSYNKHHGVKVRPELTADDFNDKRFKEYLGDDY